MHPLPGSLSGRQGHDIRLFVPVQASDFTLEYCVGIKGKPHRKQRLEAYTGNGEEGSVLLTPLPPLYPSPFTAPHPSVLFVAKDTCILCHRELSTAQELKGSVMRNNVLKPK